MSIILFLDFSFEHTNYQVQP